MNKNTIWTPEKIEKEILEIIKFAKIDTMPTFSYIKQVTGSFALTNAISKNGGYKYWAKKLNLNLSKSDTNYGKLYEEKCLISLKELGYDCYKANQNYPYDILVENVKIDVKVSSLYHNKKYGSYYTFNLEKKLPTCDFYICYCVENEEIKKIYIIPSLVLKFKTQLSIGKLNSIYDKYLNKWENIKVYNEFFKKSIENI